MSRLIVLAVVLSIGSVDAQSASFTPLGALAGRDTSLATGVSADGSVVVGTSSSLIMGEAAFRWTRTGGMVLAFDPATHLGVVFDRGFGISGDGSVMVGKGGFPAVYAVRWSGSNSLLNLGTLPSGVQSRAYGVSADGSTVVRRLTSVLQKRG